jgi:hypothetical protein|tara:strand:+ start:1546 stop:2238 length:693 start_codon:yes stop_codon:yes gene_type:complete
MAGIEAINNRISNEASTKKSSGRTKNQDRWLLKSIDEAIAYKNRPPSKGKFYPSAFGNTCDRYLYMAYNGLLDWDEIDARIKRIFDHGGTFEERMKKYLKKANIYIDDEITVKLENPPISGRIDFLIDHDKHGETPLELKTIKDEDFKQLKETPKHEHLIQLQIYLNVKGYKYGVVVYENKNDQKLKAFKVDADKQLWETILERCKFIMEMTEAPVKCTGMWYCKCKGEK